MGQVQPGAVAMMRLLTLVLVFIVAGCDTDVSSHAPQQASRPLLGSERVPLLKREALAGSSAAALALGSYFMKFPAGADTLEYWGRIAAQNGNSVGQENAAYFLRERANETARLRMQFWLRRAAEQGSPRAMAVDATGATVDVARASDYERSMRSMSRDAGSPGNPRLPSAPNDSFFPSMFEYIEAADLPRLETAALSGSRRAAERLAKYYRDEARDDLKLAEWLLVAAENGSLLGQRWLSQHLAEQDAWSRIRSIYWLRRAAMQGDPWSMRTLSKMELDDGLLPTLERVAW